MFNWQSVYKQTFQGTCLQLLIQLTMGGNPGEGHIPSMFWEMGHNPPMFCNQTAASRQSILPMLKPPPTDFKPHWAMKRSANGPMKRHYSGRTKLLLLEFGHQPGQLPMLLSTGPTAEALLARPPINCVCVCVPCFDSDFRHCSSQPIT